VIPHPVDYLAPPSLAECVAALAPGGRALAGGTWVLPEMQRGESRPGRLVDLRHAGLGGAAATSDGLSVGAMCTYADLLSAAAVAEHAPLLATMAAGITGGWAVRMQATVGGAAAAARPSSDVPAALVALDAVVRAVGPDGERTFPAHELFTAAMTSSLRPGEILTGFDIPSARGTGHGYVKLKRGGSSWPIATAAALLRLDGDGVCRAARLALGGVSAIPLLVDVGAALVGLVPDPEALRFAGRLAGAAVTEPYGDVLAPAEYRAAVAAPVARRALESALDAARPAQEERR
jgi:carbon-monoxide dehydrogenase medium subunit